ncbi:O-unit flippase [Dyadobacter beijingensis]|uniref:O-unit flippase n=1 Tax=Dyadobacter beijingensis TaxID=365489 RepID=A0ABQ2I2I9_9BACT|nr:flippase [Dyadobacter beijingensis]GGM96526.1 O-unit flippase [Dyadobacter beijingensis]
MRNLLLKIKSPVILNIIWLSLDQFSRLAIGLVVGIWIARYLGPQQWGELNYTLAIVSIITTIANLGMDGFLVKEILDTPSEKNQILGTAFVTRVLFIPLCVLVALVFLYTSGAPTNYYYLFAFLSPNFLVVPFDVIDLEFRSRLQSRRTVIAKNIAYFLGAGIKLYLLISEKSMLWFAAAIGFEMILSYVFLIISYQREQNIFAWSFRKSRIVSLLRAGWPFIVSNVAVILYMKIDQLMIGNIAGEKELGIFSSATRVTDIFIFIPMAISSSYLSVLVKAKQDDPLSGYLRKMLGLFAWMVRGALAIAIPVSIFSGQIIALLYGAKYAGAEKVLIVHVWALLPIFMGVAASQYMVIENLQKYNIYKTVIGLALNVVLNVVLIPVYGAIGAAIATLIAQYFTAVVSNYFFRSTRELLAYQIKSVQMLFSFKH